MLVPLSWLKKYVKIDLSVEEFVRRMIMSGTAVEGYEDCGAEISNVVVGKLVEIVKHPNSDHLNICQVDVGGDFSRIWRIWAGPTPQFKPTASISGTAAASANRRFALSPAAL